VTLSATVVIVNFNAGDDLLRCLAALRAQTVPHPILIMDNASSDDSTRRAYDKYRDIRIVPLRRNLGFARAVNLAAARIAETADVMVTLNPDTIPREDFLEQLISPLGDNASLAATAGTLVFTSEPDIIASAGIRVHRNGVALDARLGERIEDGDPVPVFGASGGAAAYRLDTFRALGGYCEPFFLYLEDVDLAWRMRLQGKETLSVPAAIASHRYSRAAGEGSPLKRRLLARNRLWTMARCLPASAWRRDWMHILAFDALAASHALMTRDAAAARGRLEGVAGLLLRMHERRAIQQSATAGTSVVEWLAEPIRPTELLRLRRLTKRLASH
jgi:GT2 family glycosyltransferase